MRDTFKGWYDPAAEDVEAIWGSGMVVVDTNVLLDLYRLTPASRESLLKALKGVSDRLWIPHQVGLEFHRSRDEARSDTRAKHTDLAQRVVNDTRKLVKLVGDLRNYNPAIDEQGKLREGFTSAAQQIAAELKAGLGEYDEAEEVVLDEVDRLFPAARIGPPFTRLELAEARAEAARRFEAGIPPGFADDHKNGDRRYGDYFLWTQLMARALVMQSGVIFITRDEKQDWRKEGKILPELAYEFYRHTQKNIVILHPDTFIKEALDRGLWHAEAGEDVQQVADDFKRVALADAQSAAVSHSFARLAKSLADANREHFNFSDAAHFAPTLTYDQLRRLGVAMSRLSDAEVQQVESETDENDEEDGDDERGDEGLSPVPAG